MKEPWQDYMKVGIIHFMASPQTIKGDGPILETLEKIAVDDFFDCVEVSWIKDDATRAKARDLLASSKLTVAYGAQPRLLTQKLDVNSLDTAERCRAVDEVKRGVDEAREIGAVGIAFLSGKAPDKTKTSEYRKVFIESAIEICEHAKGLPVHLETFDMDIDKCCFIGQSAMAAEICREVRKRCKNFGLMLDLSHLPLQYEKASTALSNVADCLTHAHMGNCCMRDKSHPAYGDQHPRFGIPGGEIDVDELADFLAQLFKCGYLAAGKRPILSFEVKPLPGEISDVVIANAKRTFRAAWSKLAPLSR